MCMCVSQACTMQCGATWKALAVWQLVALPFFFTTLEELYTGELVLPVRRCWGDGSYGHACGSDEWRCRGWVGERCGAMGGCGVLLGRLEQLHTVGMVWRALQFAAARFREMRFFREESVRKSTHLRGWRCKAHMLHQHPQPTAHPGPAHAAAEKK